MWFEVYDIKVRNREVDKQKFQGPTKEGGLDDDQ